MTVQPFELLENYTRHHDPHVRRNVAVAIGALTTDRSVAALLDMASSDADAEVKEEAERRLASIEPARASLVRAELAARVRADDPSRRGVANAVAGRLHLRGFDLRGPDQRLRHQLRALWANGVHLRALWHLVGDLAQRFEQAGLARRFSLRMVWAGMVGAALPTLMIALYLAFTLQPRARVYIQYLGGAIVLVPLLTLRLGRRELPLLLQWDEPAAVFRDIAETALWTSALVATTAALALAFTENLPIGPTVKLSLLAASVTTLALIAVHIGSALFAYQSKGGTAARLLRYFVAASPGVATLAVALIVVRRMAVTDPQARLAEVVWLYAVPACGALALILARLDTTSVASGVPPRSPGNRKHLASIALALPGLAALSFWLWRAFDASLMPGRWSNEAFPGVDWGALSGKTQTVSLPWRGPEAVYRFRLLFPQRLKFLTTADEQPDPFTGYSTQLLSLSMTRPMPVDRGASPTACAWSEDMVSVWLDRRTPGVLAAGCYELRVRARARPVSLWQTLDARSAKGRASALPLKEVPVVLNADSARWAGGPGAAGTSAGQVFDASRPVSWIAGREGPSLDFQLESPKRVQVGAGQPLLWAGYYSGHEVRISGAVIDRARGDAILKAGRYTVAVTPPTGYPASAYLTFLPPSSVYASSRFRMGWLQWTVTEVPSSFRFTVTGRFNAIVAELKTDGIPDMVLELVRLDDERLQLADDPEIIPTSLAAGTYDLVVKSYERRSDSRHGRRTKLPSPIQLVIDRESR